MPEPVTAAAAAICLAGRTGDCAARARLWRRLMQLTAAFRCGSKAGERYGRDAGWYAEAVPAARTERGR